MSNGNFNTINVKQLNFTGDHILKRAVSNNTNLKCVTVEIT